MRAEQSRAEGLLLRPNEKIDARARHLIAGYELYVTLNLQTPLEWLVRDRERAELPQPVPVKFGVWLPVLKRSRAFEGGTRASAFGQVSLDGGEALDLLKKYRWIVEGDMDDEEKNYEINILQDKNQGLVSRVTDDLSAYYFCEQLQLDLGCGSPTARKLYNAGYISSIKVRKAGPEVLLNIPGIGAKTIAQFFENPIN